MGGVRRRSGNVDMSRTIGVLIVLALLTYLGGYAVLLQPIDLMILDGASGYRARFPAYRVSAPGVETAVRPVAWLDQQVRPRYWAWQSLPHGSGAMRGRDDLADE